MNLYPALICTDFPSLGRVGYESMTEQTLMELLVGGVSILHNIQDEQGDFLDVNTWPGVKTNDIGNVVEVRFPPTIRFNALEGGHGQFVSFYAIGPEGSMDLSWIPRFTKRFDISQVALQGTVNTAALPRQLEIFDISRNKFSGMFSIPGLPSTLQIISIAFNSFIGSLDVTKLPQGLCSWNAESNYFQGTIDLSRLPPYLTVFNMSHTEISGTIDLRNIPSSICLFALESTFVEQETLVIGVPFGTEAHFRLDKSQFQNIVNNHGDDLRNIIE